MNCHNPVAPIRETATGLRADSITGKYLSSNGSSYLSNTSSKIG